ncbi:Uncharacterised protein [Citrobacter koseri]|uniref:Uncharacterized protein n=1 Tax=Citrobacter koseri TaxID=545 RepID=A0A2X2WEQ8_CITKO|nr:Uncharacterised protein [Citrobacter koseri]
MASGEDVPANFRNGSGNTIFSAALAVIDFKPMFAHFFRHRLDVQDFTRTALINIRNRRTVDGGVGPDRELRIAMLSQNKGIDALRADIQFLRQRAP